MSFSKFWRCCCCGCCCKGAIYGELDQEEGLLGNQAFDPSRSYGTSGTFTSGPVAQASSAKELPAVAGASFKDNSELSRSWSASNEHKNSRGAIRMKQKRRTKSNLDFPEVRYRQPALAKMSLSLCESASSDSLSPVFYDSYKTRKIPRGYAVIISNENFLENPRHGASRDQDLLSNLFGDMDFEVNVHVDLTTQQMLDTLNLYKCIDHTDVSCFVCCILTHGEKGMVHGIDCHPFGIIDLIHNVCTTPSLRGKPKIFFIDTCMGALSREEELRIQTYRRENLPINATNEQDPCLLIPDTDDTFVFYSTYPKKVSFRDPPNASLIVQAMDKYLRRASATRKNPRDLQSVMLKVGRWVEDMSEQLYGPAGKQVSSAATTGHKFVYF